ncbi:MAG: TolC family protein [Verrucomicrobiae bacterium]|nr:TolC family protein [Verrucomicrobiae bacterium]
MKISAYQFIRRLAAGMLLFAWTLRAGETPENLTWNDCVREAVENNPDIKASWHALQSSEAVRKGSYSDFFPQITVNAGRTRAYQPADESAGVTAFGGAASATEYTTQYTANITLQQMVFDGFKTRGNVDKARAEARLALANLISEKALVSYELKSAFAQLLYAQDLIGISRSIVAQRDRDYQLVGLRYESGKENKGSVLWSKANLGQAKFDLEQALRNLLVSRRQLLTSMGVGSRSNPVAAVGELVAAPVDPKPDFQALAIKTPAHYQRLAEKDAAAAGITIAQSSLYPWLSATGVVSRQDNKFFPKDNGWSVGVSATWDIFDGAQTYFNVRAARASLQQSQMVLRSTDEQTALSLARDHTDLVDAVEKVRVQSELLEAASLRADIAEVQYRNGLISFQDFYSITNDYINQQRQTLGSRRDALIAEAKWEQSRGVGAIP